MGYETGSAWERIGELGARVASLEAKLDDATTKLDTINRTLAEWRGGRRVSMRILGVVFALLIEPVFSAIDTIVSRIMHGIGLGG